MKTQDKNVFELGFHFYLKVMTYMFVGAAILITAPISIPLFIVGGIAKRCPRFRAWILKD